MAGEGGAGVTEGEGSAERSGVSKDVRAEWISETGAAGEGASAGEDGEEKRAMVDEVRRAVAGRGASGTGLLRMRGSRSCTRKRGQHRSRKERVCEALLT